MTLPLPNTAFTNKISLRGYVLEDSVLPVNLAAGITTAHIGYALTFDTSAPNTMKLVGAGDIVRARLMSVEARATEGLLVGAACFQFADQLPIGASQTFALGDTAVGVGTATGTVGPRTVTGTDTPDPDGSNFVVEINTTAAVPYVVVVHI